MIREAIILAGGKGTRLQEVVSDVPKPMAPVNGKPFLSYLIVYLTGEGVDHIILSVGYKHSAIVHYFGTKFHSAKISYSIEDQPMGTGGAIKKALKQCNDPHVLVLNGDTFFPVKTSVLTTVHLQQQAEVTLALRKEETPGRYGTVRVDSHQQIRAFNEKQKVLSGLINGGVYLICRSAFLQRPLPDLFSLETDYFEKIVHEQCIYGCVFNDYFIDIGIPESFHQAQCDFLRFPVFGDTNN